MDDFQQDLDKDVKNSEDIDILEQDPNIDTEEEKQNIPEMISTEEYDIEEPLDPHAEKLKELEGKEGIEIHYSFNGEEITEALKIFQKATLFKRNIIYTLILAAIFVIYSISIVKDPSQGLPMFLSAMCVAVIAMIWYMPLNHRRKTAKAADTNNLNFTMTVYDDCVKVGEENGCFVLDFYKDKMKAYSTANLFLLSVGKERIFLVPKRFISEQNIEKIDAILKNAFNDEYFAK